MRFDRVFVDNAAEKALSRFVAGASLNDIVKEIAAEHDLNNEQIKRICEAANVRVKRYLSDKTDNQFFTFELADWGQIIDELQPFTEDEVMNKEAIMRNDWETFDNEIFPNMEKSANIRTLNVGAIASLYTQVESAETKVRKLHNLNRDKLATVADNLINRIGDSFRNDQGSLLYSTALQVLPKKSLVDELFKTASDRFLFNTCLTPSYEEVKIAGVVNPKSRFAYDLKEYMKLRFEVVKTAAAMKRLQKARSSVLKTIRETVDKDCSESL